MIVTLKNNGFSAKIDSYGAQLISLQDPAGTEYIWQRDPKHWANCSPLLFPIVGNCRDNKLIIADPMTSSNTVSVRSQTLPYPSLPDPKLPSPFRIPKRQGSLTHMRSA